MSDNNLIAYKATIQNNLYQVGWSILYALLLSLLPVYFYYEFGKESVNFAVVSVTFLYLIQLLFHVSFFIRYWYLSKSKSVTFNLESKEIAYTDKSQKSSFKLGDINSIETVLSKAKSRGVPRWFPWDSYCYSKIILKTGETFLITSLMMRELHWPIKVPREKVESKYFCWL